MANYKKTYYFPPTWDHPRGGALAIGSVISSVKSPLPPLHRGTIQPTVESAPGAVPKPRDNLYVTSKHNVVYDAAKSDENSAGVSASFLSSVLGVGPDVSATLKNDAQFKMTHLRLDTYEWYPEREELQALVNLPAVADYFRHLRAYRPKEVFVITGVKICYGAAGNKIDERSWEGKVDVTVDPGVLAAGVPGVAKIGARVETKHDATTTVSWGPGESGQEVTEFLFAYKVQRVKVKVHSNDANIAVKSNEEYTPGALFGGSVAGGSVAADRAPDQYTIETDDEEDASGGLTGVEGKAVLFTDSDTNEAVWFVPQ